jgi:hypothetical protein
MMTRTGDYEIEVDRERRRVSVRQWGRLAVETAERLLDELDRKTARLPEGFDVRDDSREPEPFDQDDTDFIERGRRVVSDTGGEAPVRVVGDTVVSKMQFDRVVGDANYHVANAETPEQAEEPLDRLRDRPS